MREKILKNPERACILLFCLLIAVHAFEAIVLRMDETVFGENFINKFFGILVLGIVLKILQWSPKEIGFADTGFLINAASGFALAAGTFLIAYLTEIWILVCQGKTVSIGVYTMSFSLTGGAEVRGGIGFILMCMVFNIINVLMEEATFRGLFYTLLKRDNLMRYAILFQALLFGIWHIVTPLHNLVDGDLSIAGFAGLSIGYIILAGIMGIKWALLREMTGTLYAGMADHFFNNFIATNLLHVSADDGTDELMLVRVVIAQLLSSVAVTVMWKCRGKKDCIDD